jgi:hypothetical protein
MLVVVRGETIGTVGAVTGEDEPRWGCCGLEVGCGDRRELLLLLAGVHELLDFASCALLCIDMARFI